MTSIPESWEWSTIGEVADVALGRQRSPQHHHGPNMRPYLRSANVTWTGIDTSESDVYEMNFAPADAEAFALMAGDLLLNEASGSSSEVGKPAIWRGEIEGCCFQNTLLRVRTRGPLVEYLYWYCMSAALAGAFGEAGRGVNIRHLGKQGLASFPIPLPPIDEQARIVATIEERTSRLNAGVAALRSASARIRQMRGASVRSLLDSTWPLFSLGSIAKNFDGRRVPLKRSDRSARGGPFPYYGAQGIIDHIDGYLFDGDFLLVAEDGANLASRVKPIAFPARGRFWVNNHAHVIQPVDGVDSGYLELVLNHSNIQHFVSGSAQPKLTQANLNKLEVPLPDLPTQLAVVEAHDKASSAVAMLSETLTRGDARAKALRRSILSAAFSGRLEPQDPEEGTAAEQLAQMRPGAAARGPGRPRKASIS